MPKNPDRPKIRYKRVKAPPRPLLTPEQLAQRNLERLEKKHRLSPQRVNAAISKERGLITQVCRTLKVPRTTLQRYIEKHESCIEALLHARDAMGDKAENKLFEKIEQGDVRCILYYLSTVQRHRGYGLNGADVPGDIGETGPVYVEQVNIIGVPSGTFLPKEVAAKDNLVIEN
jgi:hypothetical protein